MLAYKHKTRHIPFTPADPSTLSFQNLQSARKAIINTLQRGIRRVHRHPSSEASVYVGYGGTLMTDWLVSTLPELSETFTPTTFPASITLSKTPSGSRASFLETSVGTTTLLLLSELRNFRTLEQHNDDEPTPTDSSYSERTASLRESIQHISQATKIATREDLDAIGDGCEVLYGRAGLLYALLKLRSELRLSSRFRGLANAGEGSGSIVAAIWDLCEDGRLKCVVDDIVARGKEGALTYLEEELGEDGRESAPGLMWSWHGKRYLGGAHGVSGILQILISCPKSLLVPHWNSIIQTISWLVHIQLPSENWPSKASRHVLRKANVEEDERDMLVQWCHGAPGILILFSTLLRRFHWRPPPPSTSSQSEPTSTLTIPPPLISALKKSLLQGADLVYTHGLLRKGVGLCHGVSGSIYALLSVSDALTDHNTKEKANPEGSRALTIDNHFLQALHLAQMATSYESLTYDKGEMYVPDRPYSLYEGVAGMCCAWVEVVKRVDGILSMCADEPRDGSAGGGGRERRKGGSGMPGYDDLVWED